MERLRGGDSCPEVGCGGKLVTYSTRINFVTNTRTRFLRCGTCGKCPANNKWIIPLDNAPPRSEGSVTVWQGIAAGQ